MISEIVDSLYAITFSQINFQLFLLRCSRIIPNVNRIDGHNFSFNIIQ